MKKYGALQRSYKDNSLKKYYILTRPSRLSDLTLDDLDEADHDSGWRERSRQLQVRRWRRLRHQLA
jgi:hypothetical protein